MSMTYTTDSQTRPFTETAAFSDATRAEPYVPAYARTGRKSQKKVRTWMILAPIGALALVGTGVVMMMGGEEAAPLAEPALVESVPAPLAAAPLTASPATPAPVVAPVTPAPVARETAPAPRAAAPVRRAAPATPAVETTPVEPVVAEPTGPRPYAAELNAAPQAATPAPRAPTISTQPLN